MTGGTSEAQTAVATTEGSSSSKPRQRSRKGKESGLPSESTSKDSAQIEDAPRESQTRARKGRKAHAKIRFEPPANGLLPHRPFLTKGGRPRTNVWKKLIMWTQANVTSTFKCVYEESLITHTSFGP